MAKTPPGSFLFILVSVFFCVLWFVDDQVLWPSSHFRVLAEDALGVACESVREAMLSLLEVHEDAPAWNTPDLVRFGSKFKSLQASLDNIHPELSGLDAVDADHVDLCEILAGKRVTMIGGEHIFRLHLHLLRHQERSEKKPFPCPYHEFCTHHHLCSPHQRLEDDAPRPRYLKSPTAQELVDTRSAAVNYIVSDTLLSAPNASFWAYASPLVDTTTGVRLRETFWLAAARKADVVLLARGPVSTPAPTYAGDWSFSRRVPDYVDRSRAVVGPSEREDRAHRSVTQPLDVLNAAVHLTTTRFLPDLFQLLQSVRREVRPNRRKRLIWPSSWYRLPVRGAARSALLRPRVRAKVREETSKPDHRPRPAAEHVLTSQLSALLAADAAHAAHLEDPWTLLFNAQGEFCRIVPSLALTFSPVYLQNMALREILPRYGIVFLPLDVPWTEDSEARGHGRGYFGDRMDAELQRTVAIGGEFLKRMDFILRYPE